MKSSEIIKKIQEIDPTGEMEVCIENEDIFMIQQKPAYWNGRLQRLIWNENRITGAEILQTGNKICITPLGIEELVYTYPDIPINLSDLAPQTRKSWLDSITQWRETARKLEKEVNAGMEAFGFRKCDSSPKEGAVTQELEERLERNREIFDNLCEELKKGDNVEGSAI